jgi:hypothetical protein
MLESRFPKAKEEIIKAMKFGNYDLADAVLTESQKSHNVPVDKGTLKKSGNIKPPHPALKITVGYHTPYAAIVHEGFPEMDVNVKAHSRHIKKAFGRPIKPRDVNVKSHKRHIGPRAPNPYLTRPIQKIFPRVREIFKRRFDDAEINVNMSVPMEVK